MRLRLISLSLLVLAVTAVLFPTPAHAQNTREWSGVCVYTTSTNVATIQGIQCLVANLLQIAIAGIGFVGFVMLLIGAFRYLISGGNAKGVDDGRKTMTFAIVGLVVALFSVFIITLIADFTGVRTILTFTIPNTTTSTDQIRTAPLDGGGGDASFE